MNIELESMAIDLPPVAAHPNRVAFRGVLTLLDVPSDRAPAGARGHRVLLTRAAAEKALPSLLGMGLDYAPALDRHDARRKVGVITRADVVPAEKLRRGSTRINTDRREKDKNPRQSAGIRGVLLNGSPRIEVGGYLFARDFPEVVREIRAQGGSPSVPGRALGMSYEITDARVDDLRAGVWTVSEFTFTGAAVLRRDKAAYAGTWIELSD
jgi:hypothetical protein